MIIAPSSMSSLGDIPVARALVPAADFPSLATTTLSNGYLVDSLEFGGGADQSSYFQLSSGVDVDDLTIDVLISIKLNVLPSTVIGTLSVGVAKLTPGGTTTTTEIANATKIFTFDTDNLVINHAFELTGLNIGENDLIVLKVYREGASNVEDTASEAIKLIKLNLS
jgi:hypothetical protein